MKLGVIVSIVVYVSVLHGGSEDDDIFSMVTHNIPREVVDRHITPYLTREWKILARFRWYDSDDFEECSEQISLQDVSADQKNLTYHLGDMGISVFKGTKVVGRFYKPLNTYVSVFSRHATDDTYLATYSNGDVIVMFPGYVHRSVMLRHPSGKQIISAQFSDDGRYVISVDTDQHTRVWDYQAIKTVVDILEGTTISFNACCLLNALRYRCVSGRLLDMESLDIKSGWRDIVKHPALCRYVRQAYGSIIAQVMGEDESALSLLFDQ